MIGLLLLTIFYILYPLYILALPLQFFKWIQNPTSIETFWLFFLSLLLPFYTWSLIDDVRTGSLRRLLRRL